MALALPFLIIGPFAGIAADRMNRRTILAFADIASAVIMSIVAIVGLFWPMPPLWLIIVAGLLASTVNAFFLPARNAAVPSVVPEKDLGPANALMVSTQQIVGMIGLGVNVLVLAAIFKTFPEFFLSIAAALNAITFAVSAYFVFKLPPLIPEAGEAEEKKAWQEFKSGQKLIFKDKILRVALPVNTLAHCLLAGFMVIYVRVNSEWFGGDFRTFAFIELSFIGVLAIMSIYAGRKPIQRPGLAFAFSTFFIGIFIMGMAYSQELWLFMVLNGLCGFVLPFSWIGMNVYMQQGFKDEFRGRVNSTWLAWQMGVQPVGLLMVGPAIVYFGLDGTFMLMGLGMAVPALIGSFVPGFLSARLDRKASDEIAAA